MNIACAILAGGNSRRMGRDKATIQVNGKPLINLIYTEAKKVFRDIIIISNHHKNIDGIDAPIFKDITPIQSPIVGIVSALLYADTPYVFILPCDTPFVSQKSIEYMINEIHGEDLIIPRTKNGFEPLYAIYSKSCISCLFKLIERNRLKVADIFPFLSLRILDEHPYYMNNGHLVFTNINAVDDLAILQNNEENTINQTPPSISAVDTSHAGVNLRERKSL